MKLIFLLLVSLVSLSLAAISPLINGRSVTILPCQSLYFSFDVQPIFSQFYFDASLRTQDTEALTLIILDRMPEINDSSLLCLDGYPSCTSPNAGGLNCTIPARCALPKGTWYAVVQNPGLNNASFSLDVVISEWKNARALRINDKKTDPVPPEGMVTGANWTCSNCDSTDIYDYFSLVIPVVDVPGSRMVINVKAEDDSTPTLYTYLTYKQDVGCKGSRMGTQTEIPACQLNGTQGQTWYLSVQRTSSSQNYHVKAYIDRPRIVPISSGPENGLGDKLLEPFDTVYFQFNWPASLKNSNPYVLSTVVDNVDNGVVELSQDYIFLPGQGCGITYKSCQTDVGCYLRYDPCETSARKDGLWYIGVKALSFVNANRPITFTVTVEALALDQTSMNYNQRKVSSVKHGSLQQFVFPPPPSNTWVEFHVYMDASQKLQLDSFTNAILYLNNAQFPGASGCYANTKSCELQLSATDVLSCSLQIDPCDLPNYQSGIWASVWSASSHELYWFQESVPFTIEGTYYDPSNDPSRRLQNGMVLNGIVAAGQYQLYRVATLSGTLQLRVGHQTHPTSFPVIKRDVSQLNTQLLQVMAFNGVTTLGPTCPCWLPNNQFNVSVGTAQNFTLSYCNTQSLNSGLMIAVHALPFSPTNNATYRYQESSFVLSLLLTQEEDTNPIVDLSAGPENVIYSDASVSRYYRLNFPRGALSSQALVIKTRAHAESGVVTTLKLFNESAPLIGCQPFIPDTGMTCTASSSNDGYCTVTRSGCFFDPNNSSATYIVEVARAATGSDIAIFNIYFELIDQSPQPLVSGQGVSALLEQTIYNHYYIDVPTASAGTKTLVVEAYVDSGLQFAKDAGLEVFMNDPITPTPAGAGDSGDCLCNTLRQAPTRTKTVIVINSCDVIAGRYHFGLRTTARFYGAEPTKYTLTVSLLDPIVTNNVQYDVPFDASLYATQRGIFKFNVPSTFVDLGNPPDTEKDITVKITVTRPQDVVTATLSQVTPLDCGCYESQYQCTTGGSLSCSMPLRYCTSGAGDWFLEVSVSGARDPLNLVPFTVLIMKKTPHKQVIQLPVVTGCSLDKRTPYLISGLTDNQYYQHYKLSPLDRPLGEEVMQFHFQNVTDGFVIGNLARGNLATLYCPVDSLNLVCNETKDKDNTDCSKSIDCITSADYFSVFADSNNNNDPVSYILSACRTSIKEYNFAQGAALTDSLTAQDSVTYRVSLTSLTDADTPFIVVTLDPAAAGLPFGVNAVFKQGRCQGCPTSAEWARSLAITPGNLSCTHDCKLIIEFCDLPSNFRVTDFFLTVTNALSSNLNFNVKVYQSKPSVPPDVLTSGQKIFATVPSGDGWKVYTWTLSPTDIVLIQNGIQRALIQYTSEDAAGVFVRAYFAQSRSQVMCSTGSNVTYSQPQGVQTTITISPGCCTEAGSFFFALYNPHPQNSALFSITPVLDQEADFATLPWDSTLQRAQGTVNAKAYAETRTTAGLPLLISDVQVNYPGLTDPFGWTVIKVSQVTSTTSESNVFIEQKKIAGDERQSSCYGQSVYPGTGIVPSNFTNAFVMQLFSCTAVPTSYWFGVRTMDTSAQTFRVSVANFAPQPMVFNQTMQFSISSDAVFTNYYVDIPPAMVGIRRTLRIEAETAADGDVVSVHVNTQALAGSGSSCVGNISAIPVGTAGNGGATPKYDSNPIPSCVIDTGRLYVALFPVTTTSDTVSVKLTVSGADVVYNTPPTALTPSVPLPNQQFSDEGNHYTFASSASLAPITYFTTFFTGLTSTPSFTWTRAARCSTPSNTMYCNPSNSLGDNRCSSIIFPCDVNPVTTYQLAMGPNVTADPWTIELRQLSVAAQTIGTGRYSFTLGAHELKFLRLPINTTSFAPGQNISISITSVTCGTITSWVNQDIVAGPTCFKQGTTVCTGAPCALTSISTCDGMTTDITGDYYVTVRGLQQYSTSVPIKVDVTVEITDQYAFHSLHPNERHVLYAVPTPIDPPSFCPAINRDTPALPSCCNVSDPTALVPYQPQRMVLVYPIEGASYLENTNAITIELETSRVTSAVLRLSADNPTYCNTKPSSAVTWTGASCLADITSNFRCSLVLDNCLLRDARQVFVHVEALQFLGGPSNLTATASVGKVPLAYISNTRQPFVVIDVNPSTEPQYLRFRLLPNERQFIRIIHDANRATALDYYVRATLTRVQDGTLTITKTWDLCPASAPVYCTQSTNCRINQVPNACNNDLLPCSCPPITYQSCNSDINANGQSFFQIKPTTTTAVTGVWGKIKFEFYVTRYPVQNTCEQVPVSGHKFYSHSLVAGPQQLYQFDLRHQSPSGSVILNLADSILPVRGECSLASELQNLCSGVTRGLCQQLYRKAGIPQLSVYGNGGTTAVQNYNVAARLVTVPVQNLQDGVAWSTPTSYLNDSSKCVQYNQTEYYHFTANPTADAILVEYRSNSSATVYMSKDHVSYLWGTRSCTTSGGYCSFLVGCDQNGDAAGMGHEGEYYFHAPEDAHSITVTQIQVSPIPLTLGNPVTRVFSKRGEYVVYQINNTGGQQLDPTQDLFINFNTLPGVNTWVTRGKIGDSTCSIPTTLLPNGRGYKVTNCNIHESQDLFYVHFFVTGKTSCIDLTLNLKAYYSINNDTLITPGTPNVTTTIAPGSTMRFKFNVGGLSDNTVLKVRIPEVLYGTLTHIVWKGNHVVAKLQQQPPCLTGCTGVTTNPLVSWQDICWHCGGNIYDTVFVDVTGLSITKPFQNAQFSVVAETSQWVPLDSTPITAFLEGPSRDLDFYTIPLNRDAGSLLEVVVQQGYAVEVQIWPVNCSRRVPPTPYVTMWCFQGQECQIPLSQYGDFGSFVNNAKYYSGVWTDSNLRVIVGGEDATYKIRYVTSTSSCASISSTNAPYCSAVRSGSAWGSDTTFLDKDNYAKVFEAQLERSFSCAQDTGCACATLTDRCKNYLQQYACQSAFVPCTGAGFEQYQNYDLCQNIITECGRTWEGAGLPQFNCEHNFYTNGVRWVSADDGDLPMVPVVSPPAASGLVWAWVLLAIVGVILIIVAVFFAIRKFPLCYDTPDTLIQAADDTPNNLKADDHPYLTL